MREWTPGPAWLFCPADRPDRYGKALTAADVVIVDLEDAVAPAAKAGAREALRELARGGAIDWNRTVVRVNGADIDDHRLDLELTRQIGARTVMLAKAESVESVAPIAHDVIVLLETPIGIRDAGALAAVDNVVGVMWGADDLVAGLGGTASRHGDGRYRDVARHARSVALVAAKASGRLALDAVHMDIDDVAGLTAECEDAVTVGFDGTVAIHPRQIDPIRTAYAPTAEQILWARDLLEHVGDDRAVTTFRGRMVDGPIYRHAERVLRRATEGAS